MLVGTTIGTDGAVGSPGKGTLQCPLSDQSALFQDQSTTAPLQRCGAVAACAIMPAGTTIGTDGAVGSSPRNVQRKDHREFIWVKAFAEFRPTVRNDQRHEVSKGKPQFLDPPNFFLGGSKKFFGTKIDF